MSDAEAMLRLHGVGVRYADGTVALDAVDLSVPRGQFCVLLGSSGAGKSTLLRAVNGLIVPSSGVVELDGQALRPGDLRTRGRKIATIHQGIDLVPRLSVLDNVLCGDIAALPLWRALLGRFGRARQRAACMLLAEVGLDESQLYRRASELSGGQQQRVGIARAFISRPPLVLADEPVASLDPRISRDILALLRRSARMHGATVLCSLHQIELAREFADRIVGMRGGRIVLDCAPQQLDDARLAALYQRGTSDTAVAATPAAAAIDIEGLRA